MNDVSVKSNQTSVFIVCFFVLFLTQHIATHSLAYEAQLTPFMQPIFFQFISYYIKRATDKLLLPSLLPTTFFLTHFFTRSLPLNTHAFQHTHETHILLSLRNSQTLIRRRTLIHTHTWISDLTNTHSFVWRHFFTLCSSPFVHTLAAVAAVIIIFFFTLSHSHTHLYTRSSTHMIHSHARNVECFVEWFAVQFITTMVKVKTNLIIVLNFVNISFWLILNFSAAVYSHALILSLSLFSHSHCTFKMNLKLLKSIFNWWPPDHCRDFHLDNSLPTIWTWIFYRKF